MSSTAPTTWRKRLTSTTIIATYDGKENVTINLLKLGSNAEKINKLSNNPDLALLVLGS